MSRHYLRLEEYEISKAEQKELKYFFLAYKEKKKKLGINKNNSKLAHDVESVEKAVELACGEDVGMYDSLLKLLTGEIKADNSTIPCSHSTLYEYRKKAYFYLYKIK